MLKLVQAFRCVRIILQMSFDFLHQYKCVIFIQLPPAFEFSPVHFSVRQWYSWILLGLLLVLILDRGRSVERRCRYDVIMHLALQISGFVKVSAAFASTYMMNSLRVLLIAYNIQSRIINSWAASQRRS